jgi:hypothetical protein
LCDAISCTLLICHNFVIGHVPRSRNDCDTEFFLYVLLHPPLPNSPPFEEHHQTDVRSATIYSINTFPSSCLVYFCSMFTFICVCVRVYTYTHLQQHIKRLSGPPCPTLCTAATVSSRGNTGRIVSSNYFSNSVKLIM